MPPARSTIWRGGLLVATTLRLSMKERKGHCVMPLDWSSGAQARKKA